MAVARQRLRAVTSAPRKALRSDPEVTDARRRYSECRVLGHSWRHSGRNTEAQRFGTIGFESTCDHCTTVRTKWLSLSGGTVRSTYKYPGDYSQRGEDAVTTQGWRRILLRTLDV